MKITKTDTLLALVALLAIGCAKYPDRRAHTSAASTQPATNRSVYSATVDGVELSVRTAGVYQAGSPIRLGVTLRNGSADDVLYYDYLRVESAYLLRVRTVDGHPIDSLVRRPLPEKRQSAILSPERRFEEEIRLDALYKLGVGDYFIMVCRPFHLPGATKPELVSLTRIPITVR